MNVPDPTPVLDGLMAATAKVNGLVLATRDVKERLSGTSRFTVEK